MSSLWSCLLVLALAGVTGCKSTKRSEILVGIATDYQAPAPLGGVRFEVFNLDRPEQLPVIDQFWPLSGKATEPFELPGSFGIFSEEGQRPRMRIVLTGEDAGGKALLHRTAIVTLVSEQTLFMRMALTSSCEKDLDCPAPLTCIERRCREPEVNPATLPVYLQSMETTVDCLSSDTRFRNTSTGQSLSMSAKGGECGADEFCLEGTCYKRPAGAAQALSVDVVGRVVDDGLKPVAGARVELRQGTTDGPAVAQAVTTGATGAFRLAAVVSSDASEVVATATAPGLVPQIAPLALRTGVDTYNLPLVLTTLNEVALAAGAPTMVTAGPSVVLKAGPVAAAGARLRYGVLPPRLGSGQLRTSDSDGTTALQSIGILYVDVVSGTAQVPDAPVTVRLALPTGLPAIAGAEAFKSYRLNSQGRWSEAGPITASELGVTFDTSGPGYWSIDRRFMVGCTHGKLRQSATAACPGARVVAGSDPAGLSSFDTSDREGAFCVTGAPGSMTTLQVGGTTQAVAIPAGAGSCDALATCADLGTVTVAAGDCTGGTKTSDASSR